MLNLKTITNHETFQAYYEAAQKALADHEAKIAENAAALKVATDNEDVKALEKNKTELEQKTKALTGEKTKAEKVFEEARTIEKNHLLESVDTAPHAHATQTASNAVVESSSHVATLIGGALGRFSAVTAAPKTSMTSGKAASAGISDVQVTGTEIWGEVVGARENQKALDGYNGFRANTTGLVIGAQTRVSESMIAGAGFAYTDSTIKERLSAGSKTAAKSFMIHGNLGYTLGDYFVDGLVVAGRSNLKLNRSLTELLNGNVQYTGKTHGTSILGRARAGRSFKVAEAVTVAPYLHAQAGLTKVNGYTETGGNNPFTFGAQNLKTVQVGAGVMASMNQTLSNGVMLTPRLDVNYARETQPTSRSVSGTYAGQPLPTKNGPKFGEDIVHSTLGLDVKADKTTVSLDFGMTTKRANVAHMGSVRVKYAL